MEDLTSPKPAANSGFLGDGSRMGESDRAPFQRVWVSQTWVKNRHNYKNVIIPEISTSYLRSTQWWERQPGHDQQQLAIDAKKLAGYWRNRYYQLQSHGQAPLKITNNKGPDTAILEIAIVELIPNKAGLKLASEIGGHFMDGVGMAGKLGDGSIAFELRLRDSQTGEVLAQAADRRVFDSALLFDAADYTYYKGAERTIDKWIQEMATLYQLPLDKKYKKTPSFKLIAI